MLYKLLAPTGLGFKFLKRNELQAIAINDSISMLAECFDGNSCFCSGLIDQHRGSWRGSLYR